MGGFVAEGNCQFAANPQHSRRLPSQESGNSPAPWEFFPGYQLDCIGVGQTYTGLVWSRLVGGC